LILFNEVSKVFGTGKKEVRALDNVSFTVQSGEIFGLLGPNGAGKTTSLRLLSTLLKPTKGRIAVAGLDTVKESQKVRKRIGFLSSDMNLAGSLSAQELFRFFGALNHIEESEVVNRTNRLIDQLKMEDFFQRKVETYSTGMKQKTLIGIALLHDPDIIIFDEPTNGLDIITGRVVLDILKSLKQRGKTLIISTHIMSIAEKLCDRVGIIHKGEIRVIGTLQEIYTQTGQPDLEEAFFSVIGGVIEDEGHPHRSKKRA